MIQIKLDKCTKCGICTRVCPIGTIIMTESGPVAKRINCIRCGHCVAICPHSALENMYAPLSNQIPIESKTYLDVSDASHFLRSRRSVRVFQENKVTRDKIKQLLDMARFAPSGGNTQGVSYLVIDNSKTLDNITEAYYEWLEIVTKKPPYAGSPYETTLLRQIENYRQNGVNIILRNAPCLVIFTVEKSSYETSRDSSLFSLAYAELFAPTLGLGTSISGFFERFASSGYRPLFDILKIKEGRKITAGLLVGYPKYKYQRYVDRNPLDVSWN